MDSTVLDNKRTQLSEEQRSRLSAIMMELASVTPEGDQHEVGIGMSAIVLSSYPDTPEEVLARLSIMQKWLDDAMKEISEQNSTSSFGKSNALRLLSYFGPYVHGTGIDN